MIIIRRAGLRRFRIKSNQVNSGCWFCGRAVFACHCQADLAAEAIEDCLTDQVAIGLRRTPRRVVMKVDGWILGEEK